MYEVWKFQISPQDIMADIVQFAMPGTVMFNNGLLVLHVFDLGE